DVGVNRSLAGQLGVMDMGTLLSIKGTTQEKSAQRQSHDDASLDLQKQLGGAARYSSPNGFSMDVNCFSPLVMSLLTAAGRSAEFDSQAAISNCIAFSRCPNLL